MKPVWILGALVASGSAAASNLPLPISQAGRGELQCFSPNFPHRTCKSLAAYALNADGTIAKTATVIMASNPLILMETVAPVEVKNDQICSRLRPEEINAAQFTVAGRPVSDAKTAKFRAVVGQSMRGTFGREICSRYSKSGAGLRVNVMVDRIEHPEMAQSVAWVLAKRGYSVAP